MAELYWALVYLWVYLSVFLFFVGIGVAVWGCLCDILNGEIIN